MRQRQFSDLCESIRAARRGPFSVQRGGRRDQSAQRPMMSTFFVANRPVCKSSFRTETMTRREVNDLVIVCSAPHDAGRCYADFFCCVKRLPFGPVGQRRIFPLRLRRTGKIFRAYQRKTLANRRTAFFSSTRADFTHLRQKHFARNPETK